ELFQHRTDDLAIDQIVFDQQQGIARRRRVALHRHRRRTAMQAARVRALGQTLRPYADTEACPLPGLALAGYRTAHELGQTAHDGKPQAGSAELARTAAVNLREGLEQAGLLVGGNTDAAVAHLELQHQT